MRWSKCTWYLYCAILILCSGFKFEKYDLKSDSLLVCRAYEIAKTQIGIIEENGNSGYEIEKYQKVLSLSKGSPYCLAGIYWCFNKASSELKLKNPLVKTGACNALFNYAKNTGSKSDRIRAKDLIIWRRKGSWQGHVEWIDSIGNAGWVKTIGFNTKNRVGIEGVFYQKRNIYHPLGRMKIRGFIGFSYD